MKLLCSALILVCALSASVQALPGAVLNEFVAQPIALDATVDGDVSSQCFTLYLPMLNEVAAAFSSQYQTCITVANEATANLTAEAAQSQTTYKQEVSTLCSAFTTCDQDNDTVNFFNCYAAAAQSDVSVIYDISTNAANEANTLSGGIKAILDTEYQCTNTTESNYVRDTAATYDLLDTCLKNGVPTMSTDAASESTTTTPFTTDDSSAASTTSGAASTTTDAAVASTSTVKA